ncbi:cyclic lactone autoinducer peptide [Paenibacillus spiritus]|uniref:Cyclic lactone autoinducer peptide n=1 Tax=Paenibacillus spiritus TaxID=2496557 RepID=A0A5J5GHI8_9BACL|nr:MULTISPECIES: cyclic lactone autoinducer peptide [Paenibacillus]KAA9007460.1 cyclic lactone autoinducer peptide [Paenibacillus spiritus]
MMKLIARQASSVLAGSARLFASVCKLTLHSPEIPQELRK